MVRKILAIVILIPLALAMIALAVANRTAVIVSFDPFNPASPAFAVPVPLYVLALILLAVGVVAGGMAAWFEQKKWRRKARRLEAEVRAARAEAGALRRRVEVAEMQPSAPPMALRPPAA